MKLDKKDVGYIRIYRDEVDNDVFENYCDMPFANISEEDGGNSVYFYTVSSNLVPDVGLLE